MFIRRNIADPRRLSSEARWAFCFCVMADYRLSAKIIGRSSGRSSVAAAAYRAGEQLHDERTGLSHDYTRKNGVLHSEILAPDNAPDWMTDRAKLWNAVEIVERRKDAQLAREIQLSLPHELDEDQNRNMLLDFVQMHFVDRGMIADVAMHAPDRTSDQRNIHAHVMLTLRELTSDGGFSNKKNRDWNTPEQLTDWRESWADHQNAVFKELGIDARVDHRSLADQDVDREPTQHLGPVANDMEKKGKGSRIGDENRERQQRNAERAALAQQAAEVSKQLAAETARQNERINAEKAALQSHLKDDEIAMGRRHATQSALLEADLSKRNDERRQQLEAEQQRLQQQLEADGWRKLMRDFLGKTKQDRDELLATEKNLDNIRMRETTEREALQAKQSAELNAFRQLEQQRTDSYAAKFEQDKQAALKQTVQADKPVSTPEPANDRLKPVWTRSHAPEQDNPSHGSQQFQKAANAAPEPSDAKQQAIEDHKARIREQLQAARVRDRKEYDRD